jgi:hypothetical protein
VAYSFAIEGLIVSEGACIYEEGTLYGGGVHMLEERHIIETIGRILVWERP